MASVTSVATFKARVEEFIKGNKSTEEIARYIKNAKVLDENGQRYTLGQKYNLVGLDWQPQRPKFTIDDIKKLLDKLVEEENLDVDKLGKNYYYDVYLKIKGAKIYENDKRLTLEEVFERAGHPRKAKYCQDVRQKLIDEIEEFVKDKNENCFHVPRKSLPFYETLHTYNRALANAGVKMTNEEIMHDLGYKNYSDLYYRLLPLQQLSSYRDEYGYVDSYRKDLNYKGRVTSCAEFLGLPTPLVVMLVCDEKLQKFTLTTDYFAYTKEEVLKFLARNDWSFVGIKNKAPELYNKLRTLKKEIVSHDKDISIEDVIDMMGLSEYEHVFRGAKVKSVNISNIMADLYVIASKQDGKIYKRDIEESDYRKIVEKAVKLGLSVSGLFESYDMDYVDGINIERLRKTYVKEFPYFDKMRLYRDQAMLKSGISLEYGNTKEEVFEQKVLASKMAYEEYKSQIYFIVQDESE